MNETVWELPVPATGLMRGPEFKALPKRHCEIAFSIEEQDGSEKWLSILFEDVHAYKCTYLYALTSEMIKTAYGKLVSMENSEFLVAIRDRYDEYSRAKKETPKNLRHFMICFDDGPCYEIVCKGFKVI